MMDEYFAVPISPTNKRARAQMDALLEREGIERDRNLTYSAAIYDDDGQMIATGSLFENTLRCLAVDGAHRSEGLMAVIVAHLVQAQLERGNTHLFLYTKIDSAKFFAPLGFTEIARVDGRLVFMENRRDGFRPLSEKPRALRGRTSRRGAGDERQSPLRSATRRSRSARRGKTSALCCLCSAKTARSCLTKTGWRWSKPHAQSMTTFPSCLPEAT